MRKLALGLFVAFAGGLVLAQPKTTPAPTGPTTSDLFPTKKGSSWKYKANETEVEVKVSDEKDGVATLDTIVTGAKKVASETIQVKSDGIYRTKINNTEITPPVKILELETKDGKLAAKAVGTKWKVDSKVSSSQITGEFSITKIVPKEKVGDVEYTNVIVVEGPEFKIAGTDTKVTYWFAPGKGVIKLEYSIQGNKTALELKSFEEGK